MRFWLSLFLLLVSSAAAFAQSDNPDPLRSERLDTLRYEEARTESFLENVHDNEADAKKKHADLEKALANEKAKVEPIAPRDGIAKRLKVKQAQEMIGWIEHDIEISKDYIARMQKHQRESGAELVELRAQIAAEEESLAAAKAAEEKRIADEKAAEEAHRLEMQTTWYRAKWSAVALFDVLIAAIASTTLIHYVVVIIVSLFIHHTVSLRISFGLLFLVFLAIWSKAEYELIAIATVWIASIGMLFGGIDLAQANFVDGDVRVHPAIAQILAYGSLPILLSAYAFMWMAIGSEGRAREVAGIRERLRQARWWLPRPWLWPEGLVAATGAPFRAMHERREQRRIEAEEQAFYHPATYGAGSSGMTVNVRTPIQWSEWLAIAYWIMKMALIALPAVLILSSTGTLLTMAAALVPVEWQDEVIRGLEALQDLVRKSAPQ